MTTVAIRSAAAGSWASEVHTWNTAIARGGLTCYATTPALLLGSIYRVFEVAIRGFFPLNGNSPCFFMEDHLPFVPPGLLLSDKKEKRMRKD